MEFGDYRVEIVPDTEFRLDGGAMFGVVPRTLWARVCPPDEQNRIRLNMNCVFIETADERILIETGIGDKWSTKHTEMFGITRRRSLGESLRAVGVEPDSISIVINTHLHFDHAGGNTTLNAEGHAVPAFPGARYFVSRGEAAHAEAPTERDRASYLSENWQPLVASGQLELKDAAYEVVPTAPKPTRHNRTMQCWRRSVARRSSDLPTSCRCSMCRWLDHGLRSLSGRDLEVKKACRKRTRSWTCCSITTLMSRCA